MLGSLSLNLLSISESIVRANVLYRALGILTMRQVLEHQLMLLARNQFAFYFSITFGYNPRSKGEDEMGEGKNAINKNTHTSSNRLKWKREQSNESATTKTRRKQKKKKHQKSDFRRSSSFFGASYNKYLLVDFISLVRSYLWTCQCNAQTYNFSDFQWCCCCFIFGLLCIELIAWAHHAPRVRE